MKVILLFSFISLVACQFSYGGYSLIIRQAIVTEPSIVHDLNKVRGLSNKQKFINNHSLDIFSATQESKFLSVEDQIQTNNLESIQYCKLLPDKTYQLVRSTQQEGFSIDVDIEKLESRFQIRGSHIEGKTVARRELFKPFQKAKIGSPYKISEFRWSGKKGEIILLENGIEKLVFAEVSLSSLEEGAEGEVQLVYLTLEET